MELGRVDGLEKPGREKLRGSLRASARGLRGGESGVAAAVGAALAALKCGETGKARLLRFCGSLMTGGKVIAGAANGVGGGEAGRDERRFPGARREAASASDIGASLSPKEEVEGKRRWWLRVAAISATRCWIGDGASNEWRSRKDFSAGRAARRLARFRLSLRIMRKTMSPATSRAIAPTTTLGITKMLEMPWAFSAASFDFPASELAVSESVSGSAAAADLLTGSSSVAVSESLSTAAARIAASSPGL